MQGLVNRWGSYCLVGLSLVAGACGGDDPPRDDGGKAGNTTVSGGKTGGDSGKGGASGDGQSGKGGASGNGQSGKGGASGDGGKGGTGTGGVTNGGTGGEQNGGTGGAEPGDPNAVKPGTICQRHAQILCAAEAECCTDPMRDIAACETAQKKTCGEDFMADAIAARSEAAFDADQALKVFTEIERLAKECDPSIAEFSESEEGLRSMFKGTKDDGQGCTPTNAIDKPMSGGALASCKDLAEIACLPDALGWTCTERGELGADCYSDLNCVQGLYCNNPELRISGDECRERKDDGEDCTLFNQCKSLYCKGGKCIAPDEHASFCLDD